jgi:hypothetical protein
VSVFALVIKKKKKKTTNHWQRPVLAPSSVKNIARVWTVDSLLFGWSTAQDVCLLILHTAAGLGLSSEIGSIVQVFLKV